MFDLSGIDAPKKPLKNEKVRDAKKVKSKDSFWGLVESEYVSLGKFPFSDYGKLKESEPRPIYQKKVVGLEVTNQKVVRKKGFSNTLLPGMNNSSPLKSGRVPPELLGPAGEEASKFISKAVSAGVTDFKPSVSRYFSNITKGDTIAGMAPVYIDGIMFQGPNYENLAFSKQNEKIKYAMSQYDATRMVLGEDVKGKPIAKLEKQPKGKSKITVTYDKPKAIPKPFPQSYGWSKTEQKPQVSSPYGNYANPKFTYLPPTQSIIPKGLQISDGPGKIASPLKTKVITSDFKIDIQQQRLGRSLTPVELADARRAEELRSKRYIDNKKSSAISSLQYNQAVLNSDITREANVILSDLGQAPIALLTGSKKVTTTLDRYAGKAPKTIPTSRLSGDPVGVLNEYYEKKSITDWAKANTDIAPTGDLSDTKAMYAYYDKVMSVANAKKSAYTKIAKPLEAELDAKIAAISSQIGPIIGEMEALRRVRYRSGSPDAAAQGRAYGELQARLAAPQAVHDALVAERNDLIYAYAAIPQDDINKLQEYQTELKSNVKTLDKNIKTVQSAKTKLEIQLGIGAQEKSRQLLFGYQGVNPIESYIQSFTNPLDSSLQSQQQKVQGIQTEVAGLQKTYDDSVTFRRELAGMSSFINPYKGEGGLDISKMSSDVALRTQELLQQADIYAAARNAMGDWNQNADTKPLSASSIEALVNPTGVSQTILDNTSKQLASIQAQVAEKEKLVSSLQKNNTGSPLDNAKLNAEAFNLQDLQKQQQELTKIQSNQAKELADAQGNERKKAALESASADATKAMLSSLEAYTTTRKGFYNAEEDLRRQANILMNNLNFAITNKGKIDSGGNDPILKENPGSIGGLGGNNSSTSKSFKIDKSLVPASGKVLIEMKYSFLPQSPVGKTVHASLNSAQLGSLPMTAYNYNYTTGERDNKTVLVEVPVDQEGNVRLDFQVNGELYHKTSKGKKKYINYGGSFNIQDVKLFAPNQEKMLLDTGVSYLQQERGVLADIQGKRQAASSAKSFLEGGSSTFTSPKGTIATYSDGKLDIKNPEEFKTYFGGIVDTKVFEATRELYPALNVIQSKRSEATSNIDRITKAASKKESLNSIIEQMNAPKFTNDINAVPNPNYPYPYYHWKDWRTQRSNAFRDTFNVIKAKYPNVSDSMINDYVGAALYGGNGYTTTVGDLERTQAEYNALRQDYLYSSNDEKTNTELAGYQNTIFNLDNLSSFVKGTSPKLTIKENGEEKVVAERLQTGKVDILDEGLFNKFGVSIPKTFIADTVTPGETIDALEGQVKGQASSFDELYEQVKVLGTKNTVNTSQAQIDSINAMKRKGLISPGEAKKQIQLVESNKAQILDAIAKDEYLPNIDEFDTDEISDAEQIKAEANQAIREGVKRQGLGRFAGTIRGRTPIGSAVGSARHSLFGPRQSALPKATTSLGNTGVSDKTPFQTE